MLWEIKFDGFLSLPSIKNVNLKFSTYFVIATDVKDQRIMISKDRKLKFYVGDMHKVLDCLVDLEILMVLMVTQLLLQLIS